MNSKKKHKIYITVIFLAIILPVLLSGQNDKLLRLHVFYTNDMQSQISGGKATFLNPEFPPFLGGGASMATIIKAYRQREISGSNKVLIFDGGDFHNSASPLGEKSQGKAVIDFMNLLRYTAIVPGYLDFEPGINNLKALAESAQFPLLTANMIDTSFQIPVCYS